MNEIHLDEFDIISFSESADGTYVYNISPSHQPTACPFCNSTNIVKNGSANRSIRDLPSFGHSVKLFLYGNRYLCRNCRKSFTQSFRDIDDKSRLTNRMRDYIKGECLTKSLTAISRDYGISATLANNLCKEVIKERDELRKLYSPEVLGIDEININRIMRGIFTDVKERGIIELTPSRKKSDVMRFLDSLPNNENIKVVTMDMWRGYRDAVYECLPYAVVVVDKFHVIWHIQRAMDIERKKALDNILKDKTRSVNMKNISWYMKRGSENLTYEDQCRLMDVFTKYPVLAEIHRLKEDIRDMYRLKTRIEAEAFYADWKARIPTSLPAYESAARTIDNWHIEIFNYFDYPYTNALTEGSNSVIRAIERMGRGYTFELLRGRVLYGTPATTRRDAGISNKRCTPVVSDTKFEYMTSQRGQIYTSIPRLLAYWEYLKDL